jgi:hypothetical protein
MAAEIITKDIAARKKAISNAGIPGMSLTKTFITAKANPASNIILIP